MKRFIIALIVIILIFFNLRSLGFSYEYDRQCCFLPQKLDVLLQELYKRPSEYDIHNILQVLDAEIAVADGLLKGVASPHLSDLVCKRNDMLCVSVPSVKQVYSIILDQVTDQGIEEYMYMQYVHKKKQLHAVLSSIEQQAFLLSMYDRLVGYATKMRIMLLRK